MQNKPRCVLFSHQGNRIAYTIIPHTMPPFNHTIVCHLRVILKAITCTSHMKHIWASISAQIYVLLLSVVLCRPRKSSMCGLNSKSVPWQWLKANCWHITPNNCIRRSDRRSSLFQFQFWWLHCLVGGSSPHALSARPTYLHFIKFDQWMADIDTLFRFHLLCCMW